MTEMTRLDVVLGDWSDDGHGKSEKYPILVNMPTKDIQNAYKASCKKLGISFNHNEDFTETKRGRDADNYRICCEYENNLVHKEVMNVLAEHHCDLVEEICENEGYIDKDLFVMLLMWFIQQSLPELKWEKVKEKNEIPVLNGYWDETLNVQFGYGLYN